MTAAGDHGHAPARPRSQRRRAAGGQVVVLFALAAVAVVAVVGLAFDAGRAYVDQRGLQAAADTAADGGARMLAQDYDDCLNGVPLSNGGAAINSTVGSLIAAGVAGQSKATSFTAVLTDSSGASIGSVSGSSSTGWCSAGTWAAGAPRGVGVTAVDAHQTELLPVVGITHSQETAKSISVFTHFSGIGAPFIAWYENCITKTGIRVGDTIDYHASNHWSDLVPCETNYVNSKFKGDLKPEGLNPNPVKVPGWINAQPGQGSWGPNLAAGQLIWIPMVDVICDGVTPVSPGCQEPPASVVLPRAPYCGAYGLATTEELYLCSVAQVEVLTGNACTKSATCSGTVERIVWGTPGSTVNLGLQGVAVVELLQ
ncbi:MAG TPA: pilus assembly protein TadG-related protein [Candidatus Micrarchaeia archaeon]|nr:pilus assembly protein TadG-related protein [Candidatus Micrarchaeia archaeon]